MFIFANFVEKVDFEPSQSQRMGVALAEFYLFELSLCRVLGESCFKGLKVVLEKYFYN